MKKLIGVFFLTLGLTVCAETATGCAWLQDHPQVVKTGEEILACVLPKVIAKEPVEQIALECGTDIITVQNIQMAHEKGIDMEAPKACPPASDAGVDH